MRSIFGAAALLIGCIMMTGCSSVNSGCNIGGGAGIANGAGLYGGGGCPGCATGQCQVGKSLLSTSFTRLTSLPHRDYGSGGAAVGTCASQACSALGGFGGGGCGAGGIGGGGCGLGGFGGGLGGGGGFAGHGGGHGAGGGCGPEGCGLRDKFKGLFAGSHPYGNQPPHTANASVGQQAPGGGQAPAYAYPYYTTRGPRDFLLDGCGPPPIMGYSPRRPCVPSIGF